MIIPFFLPNRGCPRRCVFCNQSVSSGGEEGELVEAVFHRRVAAALSGAAAGRRAGRVEIAFYGGNFTGLEPERRVELLRWAGCHLRSGAVDGLRVSTRPDCLGDGEVAELKAAGVSAVEVGLQSLDDRVLARSGRGHTAADCERAVARLHDRGLEAWVHLMPGLPGDSAAAFDRTVRRTVSLRPDRVRIHPTLVLRGAALEEEYRAGRYRPLTLAEAVDQCASALRRFSTAGIRVVRLGLQPTPGMTDGDDVVAGPFHPAFGSLVREALFLRAASSLLSTAVERREVKLLAAPEDLSCLRGQRNGNLLVLRDRFRLSGLTVAGDATQPRGTLVLESGPRRISIDCFARS